MKIEKNDSGKEQLVLTRAEWEGIGQKANWIHTMTKEGKAWKLQTPEQQHEFETSPDFENTKKTEDGKYLIEFAKKSGFDVVVGDDGRVHVTVDGISPSLLETLLGEKKRHEDAINKDFGHGAATSPLQA